MNNPAVPSRTPTRRSRRIQTLLPTLFAEFAQPPLQDFLPVLPEEEPVTDDVIYQLLSAVEHPGLRPSNAQRLLNFYLLG